MSYFKSDTITFEAALTDLQHGSEKAQIQAAEALAEVTSSDERIAAASELAKRVSTGPQALRIACARSLGELGQSIGLDALVEATTSDIPPLRQVALIALGRLGLGEGFDAAQRALESGSADARFQAARTVVEIDPDWSYQLLLDAIASEEDPEVVGALALALGEVGNPEAADALVQHLSSPRDETAFEVAYSLALLGDARGATTLSRFVDTPGLGWDAIEGLERSGGPDAIEALAGAITRRRLASELQMRAASGLLALAPEHEAGPAAREALIGGLSSWKLHLRALATDELARNGGDWAIAALDRLRTRRRGTHLLAEIDEAIAAIKKRGTDVR